MAQSIRHQRCVRDVLCGLASADGWSQLDLVVTAPAPGLYRLLGDTARTLLVDGSIDDVFFMHKAPGMRLRYRCGLPSAAGDVWAGALAEAVRRGLITGWTPAVYEPEQRLFGGPLSMRSVHRVFTADSLAWLGYHAVEGTASESVSRWSMSLLMIRSLLDALGVVGWEHIDVWDRISRDAGRTLAPEVTADPALRDLSVALGAAWARPELLRNSLSAPLRRLAGEYDDRVHAEAPRWIADYFSTEGATVGVRHVAAFVVVYHWNRAGLAAHHQALVTEALAATMPGAGR